jgi:hypothetical protein
MSWAWASTTAPADMTPPMNSRSPRFRTYTRYLIFLYVRGSVEQSILCAEEHLSLSKSLEMWLIPEAKTE